MFCILLSMMMFSRSISCLRISDAFVSDIEKLEPATSNRIETFVFPTKIQSQRYQDILETSNLDKMTFQPLYFKFKHKLEKEVRPSDLHVQGTINNYAYYGNFYILLNIHYY